MQFKEVLGNGELKSRLVRMVDSGRTGHSLMLVERDGCGALPMAMALVQYMMCPERRPGEDSCGVCPVCRRISGMVHPDVHFAFPVNVAGKSGSNRKPLSGNFLEEWRSLYRDNPYFTEADLNAALGLDGKVGAISVAEAREILDSLSLKSYEGRGKFMVVWLPERMNAESANRLLKIVEEPMADTYFIFITHAPERIISTIRSRSQLIRLYPVPVQELVPELQARTGLSMQEATVYAHTAGGSLGMALDMAGEASSASFFLPAAEGMLEATVSGDLVGLLEGNDTVVAMGRERQKEFCLYLEGLLRKMMMRRQGLDAISDVLPQEAGAVDRFGPLLPESFFGKAFSAVEEARTMVEANVNAKMVFCHLSNVLFALVNFGKSNKKV